jgi:hypothetical protein
MKCYVVIYDDFSWCSGDGTDYTSVKKVFRNKENAVRYVKDMAAAVLDFEDEEHLKVVYDGPHERWPWLFTWENDRKRQLTYKVVPYEIEDWDG